MSFEQNYQVPSTTDLLAKLVSKSIESIVLEEAKRQGIKIKKREKIVLEDDPCMGKITGEKITLNDGRVYVLKLVKRTTFDGNYCHDIYEYCLENKKVKVKHVNYFSKGRLE